MVRLLVTESGEVSQAWISQTTGFPRLDAAALEVTRTWRMQPGTVEGKPRCMWGKFAITFHIDEHLTEELVALVPEAQPFAIGLIRSMLVVELLSWPASEVRSATLECAVRPIDGALKRKDAADVFVDGVLSDKYRAVVARYADNAVTHCLCLFKQKGSAPDGKAAACGAPPSLE